MLRNALNGEKWPKFPAYDQIRVAGMRSKSVIALISDI